MRIRCIELHEKPDRHNERRERESDAEQLNQLLCVVAHQCDDERPDKGDEKD
jgi:hypothetical protein